jgi:hypothetical protein
VPNWSGGINGQIYASYENLFEATAFRSIPPHPHDLLFQPLIPQRAA